MQGKGDDQDQTKKAGLDGNGVPAANVLLTQRVKNFQNVIAHKVAPVKAGPKKAGQKVCRCHLLLGMIGYVSSYTQTYAMLSCHIHSRRQSLRYDIV